VKNKILISEVGPRDGLQNCKGIMPTAVKKRWIKGLYDAGLREIEVGSFVPPKLFPQLADTAEIVAFAKTLPHLRVLALVPNLRGARAAIEAGVTSIGFPLSCSETHSMKNLRQTHNQAIANVTAIAALIKEEPENSRPEFEGALSTAFGCSIIGNVSESKVIELAERLIEAGVDELGLSDTVGYADPKSVKSLIRRVRAVAGDERVKSVHLHNTYGFPASPGASGNIVTEDLVYMFETMGVDTGIDLEALIECRAYVAEGLPNEPLYGMTPNAGLPKAYSSSAQ